MSQTSNDRGDRICDLCSTVLPTGPCSTGPFSPLDTCLHLVNRMENIVSRASQGFLGLPAELRNFIYELHLIPTLQRYEHAWAHPPPSTRFEPLFALALVNRQVNAEATSLFYQSFAPNICLYFNDNYRLYEFHEWAMRREYLHRLRFSLRIFSDLRVKFDGASFQLVDFEYDVYSADFISPYYCPMALMCAQPGFRPREVIRTFYDHPTHGLAPRRPPKCDISTEFGIFQAMHAPLSASADRAAELHKHVAIRHPHRHRSLSFTFHLCRAWYFQNQPEHGAMVEMEGELQDLDVSAFSMADRHYHRYQTSRFFSGDVLWWRRWDIYEDTEPEDSEVDSWQATEDEASDDGLGEETEIET